MKHFCFLTGLYPRYDTLMFVRQGKSLVSAGYKVTYVVCDGGETEMKDGIEIISSSFIPKNRFERFLRSKKAVMDLAIKIDADIYQISDPEMISCVEELKKREKKVIFNLREFYPDMITRKSYIPKLLRKTASNYYASLMKKRLAKYDAVFTVTDWIWDILRNEYKLGNAYLLTNFPIINKSFELSWKEYKDRPDVLCYEGTIYSSSRQENVFNVLEEMPNVRYVLAGKIDENYDWIKEQPYWNKVKFIDGFKFSELPMIFAQATISNVFRDFCGRDGSLGVLKVFDSMEAALPVLFADVPLYRSINDKYHCGICVDPNSVDSIKSAIEYLVNYKEEAYQMGQNGRKAVLEEYNWDRQADFYLRIISTIMV